MKILVIEDDEVIADRVKVGLEKAHFTVDLAFDGDTGLAMAREGGYALVILDLMLPKRDGFSICEVLRMRRNSVPILMMTARDAIEDKVRGLEGGADDYLSKPFDFRELIARVVALVRRDRVHKAPTIRIGDLEVDTLARRVRRAGQDITLTPFEYGLLEALASNEGRTLSREMIQDKVWGEETFSNTISFHMALLRKKVDSEPHAKLIHTVHGVGYVLRGPGDVPDA